MKQYENITNLHLIANLANANKQIEINEESASKFAEEFFKYDFSKDFSFISLQIEEDEEIQTLKDEEVIEFIEELIEAHEAYEEVNGRYYNDYLGLSEFEKEAIEHLSNVLDSAEGTNIYGGELISEYSHVFEMIYYYETYKFIGKYPVEAEIAINEFVDMAGVEALIDKQRGFSFYQIANIALHQGIERIYYVLAGEFEEMTGYDIVNGYIEEEELGAFNTFVKNTIKKIEEAR